MRTSSPSRLSRHQAWTGAALGLCILAALVALYAPSPYGLLSPRVRALPVPASRSDPVPTVAPELPAARSTVAARLSREEVIQVVSSQSLSERPERTLGQIVQARWTAEYRGDGTWLVRAGEPAWLLMEDRREAMPVNVAAINLQ